MSRTAIDIDNIDLDKLRKKLKYGDRTKIIERTGYCKQYVYSVLSPNNSRMNADIIQAAIELIEEGGPKVEVSEDLANELAA